MNKDGNVFGRGAQAYDAHRMPVWLEVKERKIGGGTIDVSKLAKGTLIPLGVPVYLPKMGGDAVILDSFKVDGAVTEQATAIKFKGGAYNTLPKEGMIVGKLGTNGKIAKAAALGAEGVDGFAIAAGSLGALSDGDVLVVASAAGSTKEPLLPTGLSWRQIFIGMDVVDKASVAVVTKGQILGDRIPAMPEVYKEALTGITFEYEL